MIIRPLCAVIAFSFYLQASPRDTAVRIAEEAAARLNAAGTVRLVKEYTTFHNGVRHFVFAQQFDGVDVAQSDFVVNIGPQGEVLNSGGTFYAAPEAGPPAEASLSASIRAAMRWADPVRLPDYLPMEVQSSGKTRRFARVDRSGDIEARRLWHPVNGRLIAAWQFAIADQRGHLHAVTLDSASQTLLESHELTRFQAPPPPRGLVFTGNSPQPNPTPGVMLTAPAPFVQRTLVSFAGDPQASPAGWVEGTETAGNNAIVGRNPLGQTFLGEPITAKSPTRDFQFPLELGPGMPPPTEYIDAAVVNLFYWMNRSHDLFWHAGFNEPAGAYQRRNFGRGGVEGDPMYAYAHFGVQQTFQAALNNAFYTTRGLEDGAPAMIGMFLFVGPNNYMSDGSYDSEVMVHEYTHGVSLRLVRNLSGHQGGAMGEAWSDFFALEFTLPDGADPDGVYPTGEYVTQLPGVGVRTRAYTTNMALNPITFGNLGRVALLPQIHNDGGIWVQALWEMRSRLIRQFGEREGRRRARMLVIDGMKMSIPSPTFVDARDAILLADRVTFKGESQRQIWDAFARRGLGATAFARSNNTTDVTQSMEVPTNTAVLSFSKPTFLLGEQVRVIVHDTNFQGDVGLVQLTSGEVGDLETIRLRRQGSILVGTINTTSAGAATPENGVLSMMPGSVISAYYNDPQSDSGFRQISVSAETRPPYSRRSQAAQWTFPNETALNLRGPAGSFLGYELPWDFPFFGRTYGSVRVHANGLLSFDLPPASPCLDVIALGTITGIAPLYMDMRTSGTSQPNQNVFVSRPSADAVTFRWAGETAVLPGAEALTPQPVNFAATLWQDGRIRFDYGPGNEEVVFPSPLSIAAGCGTSPAVGISNGTGTALPLVTEYSGRASLNGLSSIQFEPATGASSVPEIRVRVPESGATHSGVLASRLIISDPNHPVSDVWILIDGVLRGRAVPTGPRSEICAAERLQNCNEFGLNLNFATLQLTPGQHIMRIRAMNSRGGMTDHQLPFTIGEGQSLVPRVAIESPDADAAVTGALTIRGYAALETLRVVGVDVIINGINYGRAIYGQPRPEICSSLGFTSPNCPGVGWMFNVNSATNFIPLANGEHLLQVRVQDESGRFTTYPETPIRFRVDNASNQPPTGLLTSPRPGERVSGTLLVWGWAWDPDGRIATVQLVVDGMTRATIPYGQDRAEQCQAIPDVSACPNIGFSIEWNTRTVLNGPHVLGVRLLDDRGRAVVIPQNATNGMTIVVEN